MSCSESTISFRESETEPKRTGLTLRRRRNRCVIELILLLKIGVHITSATVQVRRIASERAQSEVERILEEEQAKRRSIEKKHAVCSSIT